MAIDYSESEFYHFSPIWIIIFRIPWNTVFNRVNIVPIFLYFINKYMVIDDADLEFIDFRSIRIIILQVPRNTAFNREKNFSSFYLFYQPVN